MKVGAEGLRWDESCPGSGARLGATKTSFVFKYARNGRDRWMTLGRYGGSRDDMTIEQGQERWRELRGLVASGGDPAREVRAERELPTVAEMAERWMAEEIGPKRTQETARDYRGLLDRHILP